MEGWRTGLKSGSLEPSLFRPVTQLRAAIDAFIESYNQHAAPFQWRKANVHPKGLASRITDL